VPRAAAALAAVLLFLLPQLAAAKQGDPRLDGLFARLKAATTQAEAAPVEAEIWAVWGEAPDPESGVLLTRAEGAIEHRDYTGALDTLDTLVRKTPDFAEAWNKRATVRYLIRDYRGSVEDIRRTLALEPRHFGALSGLGLIYLAVDDPKAAARSFQAALAVYPLMPGAKAQLEMLQGELKGEPL
jgi:tetratricopeptide (TPR) repeat protein